jgi:VWFA-related protein
MRQLGAFVAGSVVLALAIALPHAQSSQRPSERRARQVYVSVLDRDNKPVQNLGAADFVVREDNVAREVLNAVQATEQLTIAVTIDDSQSATHAIQFFRDGLPNFVKKLDGKAEIALSTVGERPTPLVEYTTSAAQLQKGIGRLFARPGSGAYLLEALVELSRGLEKRTAPEGEPALRKHIVALTVESGPEFSNLYYERVLDALKKSGATLHVLAIGNPASSDTDEMKNRNIVIAEGTSLTGGRRDQVLAESGISDRLGQLADELTNQYLVSYSRPETLIPPEKLDVSVSKPGLTVRAPKRIAAR